MDISIIIVNYNTVNLVVDCIKSILAVNTNKSYEIIVVDNASNESLDILSEIENLTLVKNELNLGFGTANNIGASIAKGDFLFFLNSDTIIYKDVFSIFIESYYKISLVKNIGAIGLHLYDADGLESHSYGNFPNDFRRNIRRNSKNYFSKEVDIVIGADLFIRKDLFLEIGGFDENIFLYEEEMELQYRLSKLGYSNLLVAADGIIHLEGKSSSSYFKRVCSFKSLCYIRKKHLGKFRYILWRIKWCIYAIFFFKNRKISIKEKLDYLILTLTYKL